MPHLQALAGGLAALSTFVLPAPTQESVVARTPAAADASAITLERIMADPEWVARSPESPWWGFGSRRVYFRRERAGRAEDERDVFELDLVTGVTRQVPDAELGRIAAPGGVVDAARERRLFARHGDLFLLDLATLEERQLTRTEVGERPLGFVGGDPLYERGGELLVRELATGLEFQLVDLRYEDDPLAEGGSEQDDDRPYLERQQERLLGFVAERRAARERDRRREREREAADPTRAPRPIYLGDGYRELATAVAPTGRHLLLALTDDGPDRGARDSMPVWITDSSWVEPREVRAHVGYSERAAAELRLVDLDAREVRAIDLSGLPTITEDPLAFLDADGADAPEGPDPGDTDAGDTDAGDAAAGDAAAGDAAGAGAGRPRGLSASRLEFAPDGARAVAQLESHDNKDRWIVVVEADDAELRLVEHLRDEAWINWSFNELGWLDDGRLWYLSEASGWSQLYLWDPADDSTARLTEGEFEVTDVTLAPDGRTLYFLGNAEHPGRREVWRVDVGPADGAPAAPERLTDLGGMTEYTLSPDGSALCLRSSFALQPPELYFQVARPGATVRRLTDTVEDAWEELPWIPPRVVGVPSDHGRPIWSRVYLPPDAVAAPAGERPLVIFVHGAGYLQNAHHGWSRYFREFMFHSLLAHRGYVVLDMDYRASSGYGRDWRTAIYRRMGTPELEDLLDGIEHAVAEYGVDPEKVGVYGGSYGGFMTLMALFRAPEAFAAGAALRPVTDWAHYNHGYTSNILNTPERDPEAFERSSPIEFASGLADPLLICHGLVDDNVLAKDSIRLAQRLIELGKDGWELALFPVEPHGFQEPSSWRDEYARILALFEEHVRGVDG